MILLPMSVPSRMPPARERLKNKICPQNRGYGRKLRSLWYLGVRTDSREPSEEPETGTDDPSYIGFKHSLFARGERS